MGLDSSCSSDTPVHLFSDSFGSLTLPVILVSEAAAALPSQWCSQGRQLYTGSQMDFGVGSRDSAMRKEHMWGEDLGEYS